MFERDRWQEILYALKENKLRSFLTAFGIFWGIFMLMVMLGAGSGLQNGIKRNFGDFAPNSCVMFAKTTTMPYKGFKKGRTYNFELKDIELLRLKVPGIDHISSRYFQYNSSVSRNNKTEAFSIAGDLPEYNIIDPVNILKGRFINQNDIDEQRKDIVIGQRVADILFGPDEDPIGKYLKIKGIYFEVTGVFSSKKIGGNADFENKTIEMPLNTMQKAYNLGNVVSYFLMTSKSKVTVKDIEDKSLSILKAAHYINPDDEMAIGHFNIEELSGKLNGLFVGIRLVIWVVGLGTLFAGVVGVSNIMLIVVRERTQEFGIQRALGATPWTVMSQLMMESVLLVTTAGYIGLFIGIGLVELINFAMAKMDLGVFYNPQISLEVALGSLLILIISGLIAAIIPARKAVSMKPIDAIRSEYK
jgi:putative ABC transport system permease protein